MVFASAMGISLCAPCSKRFVKWRGDGEAVDGAGDSLEPHRMSSRTYGPRFRREPDHRRAEEEHGRANEEDMVDRHRRRFAIDETGDHLRRADLIEAGPGQPGQRIGGLEVRDDLAARRLLRVVLDAEN